MFEHKTKILHNHTTEMNNHTLTHVGTCTKNTENMQV